MNVPPIVQMPGALDIDIGDEEEEFGSGGEEDSEGDEEAPILPVRIARGLLNMIWGGGAAQNAEDSDEESDREQNGGNDRA
jgi:hypothetical protein